MEANKVVCMDNLEFMKTLPSENIDLIYGDILFGTGKKFKDYQDLKPDKNVIEDFYIPRIKEMYRVLKNNGSIYLQMDYRINHWIRYILDEIFGENNFVNEIIWQYYMGGKGKKEFAKKHDTILFYCKNKGSHTFNQFKVKRYLDFIPSLKDDSKDANTGHDKIGYYSTVVCPDVWSSIKSVFNMSNEYVNYNTQKPLALMERIIKASSNEGDLVGDFFMGSGSFIVKAKELNRNYIGCDINPKAVEITNLRLTS